MTFDASHALRFINQARAATGLPALTELPFTGAVRVDERSCVLARALQAEVGGSADPRFRDHFVVRLGDQAQARAVASGTGQPCNDRAEVLLPDPLARLAVAFDRGHVQRRDASYVPPGQLSFDDLETVACRAAGGRPQPGNVVGARQRRGACAFGRPPRQELRRPWGRGPAVSGPGRNGRRPGRVPQMIRSIRTQRVEHGGDREVRQPQPSEAGGLERLGERRQLRSIRDLA